MNIKIANDEKNPLFKRREVKAKLGYDNKTPSRLEIRKQIAKKLGVKEELIVVKRIKPDYGTPAAELEFNIYDDEKTLKEIEEEYMVSRHLSKEKKETAAAEIEEEKKEEVKKEEGKEEKKPEEKKEEPKKEEEKK
ncbi:hypothetical protein AYK26_05550 [Euryarchaeota archaeon SM23-78]|nr:MAG: hypothetical protein AYK26_05550 [Euryarchaeota archaeon SM23-78]MBW3000827.1 30S ribosomal protein S24e [Candidatus Woesearchaeota archaeon]